MIRCSETEGLSAPINHKIFMNFRENSKREKGQVLKALILFLTMIVALLITMVFSNQFAKQRRLNTKTKTKILADNLATSVDLMSAIDEESQIRVGVTVTGPTLKFGGDHIDSSYSGMDITIQSDFHDTVFHTSRVSNPTSLKADQDSSIQITDEITLPEAVAVKEVSG